MRTALFAFCSLVFMVGAAAGAPDAPKDVKGLYLLTDYPAVSVRPGTTANISLRLQNYDVAPERFALSVDGVPSGWTATLLGGGQPVAAAMPATNSGVSLELRLEVPREAPIGTQTLTINAQGQGTKLSLPIDVKLAKELPAKLSLQPQLPQLRGSPRSSFDFQISIKNDSGKRLVVNLAAQAPQNFQTSFTESYGSQELSAVPIEAGQSKDVKLHVQPPNTVTPGQYKVSMRATAEDVTASTELTVEITGQPKLDVSGRNDMLNAEATAGKDSIIPIVVRNTGTAPAENLELSGSGPSNWQITMEPKNIDRIAPDERKEVQAHVTPPAQAIAGDYIVTIRASARGDAASNNFRTTVITSTVWGIVGVGIIGAALLIMVGAVARFGRR
ncbi:MAG: NEW3 domain-containing protein [Xanthobacteraceae bacterium]